MNKKCHLCIHKNSFIESDDECSCSYYISDAQTDISSYILRDITLPAFLNAEPHPELLILLLFSENLLANEFIRVSSMLSLPSTPSGNIITDNQGKGTFMETLKITYKRQFIYSFLRIYIIYNIHLTN